MLNSCVQVPLLDNIHWKELSVLMYVWVAFLIVQILKVVNIWFFLWFISYKQSSCVFLTEYALSMYFNADIQQNLFHRVLAS